jgi:hypothetical protein
MEISAIIILKITFSINLCLVINQKDQYYPIIQQLIYKSILIISLKIIVKK